MDSKDLKVIPIFSELSEARLTKLFLKFKTFGAKRGTLLIQEGDPGKELFIVGKGTVKIFLSNADGREATLNLLKPYDYFGELSLLDNLPRSASAITLEPSTLYTLDKAAFHQFLRENPEGASAILKATSLMVRRLTEQVHSLSFQDVQGRVLKKISELYRNQDPITTTHQELAEMIGTARETVTRAIRSLEQKKKIRVDKTGIHVISG